MTVTQACEIANMILASYPQQRQKMTDVDIRAMYKVYAATLEDMDADAVQLGVLRLVKTEKWMPTVSEVRRAAMLVSNGRKREGGEAWKDVLKAIGRYGCTRTPGVDFAFEDPVVARAVDALGWRELCMSEDQIPDRARFIDLYANLAEHNMADLVSGITPRNSLPSGTRPLDRKDPALPVGELIKGYLSAASDEADDPGHETFDVDD